MNWYGYCGNEPVNRIDITGYEWGYIRDLANSLVDTGTIYSGGVTYTSTDRESTKVKIGDGYYYKQGEFYYNGDAEIPRQGGRYTKRESIAENRNGSLYMERTDFYRAMNINYRTGTQTFTVTNLENGLQRLTAGVVSGGITASVHWGVGVAVGFIVGESVGYYQFAPGTYTAEYILGEVYNFANGQYEYILTTTYYKHEVDDKGNSVRTVYLSYSQYNMSFEESVL